MENQNTALVVIDMQADYIGEKSKNNYYSHSLIDNVNEKITDFQRQKSLIVYVKNVGRRKKEPYISDFAQGLSIASDNIILKEKASMFCSSEFLSLLNQNHISQLEIVGIDGNCCVAKSSIDASKYGFSVIMPLKYIGIKDKERFANAKKKLTEANVIIIE